MRAGGKGGGRNGGVDASGFGEGQEGGRAVEDGDGAGRLSRCGGEVSGEGDTRPVGNGIGTGLQCQGGRDGIGGTNDHARRFGGLNGRGRTQESPRLKAFQERPGGTYRLGAGGVLGLKRESDLTEGLIGNQRITWGKTGMDGSGTMTVYADGENI